MSCLLKYKSVVFTDDIYLLSDNLYKQISIAAAGFQAAGIKKDTTCLLAILDPLETIIAVFALLSLKAIVAMINQKLPNLTYNFLLSSLGEHVLITAIPPFMQEMSLLEFDHDKISILLATSGSSGNPKWICSTLNNWITSALGSLHHFDARSYQPWILSLPLFHVSGLSIVFRAILSNAPLVISKKMQLITGCRYSFVPMQLVKFIKDQTIDTWLKTESILIGGGKLDTETFTAIKHLPIYITYGMTEVCSQITCSSKSPADLNEGICLKYRQIELDENGQIKISGEAVCDYIWENKKLKSLKTKDGFYATKDHGFLSQIGNLTLLGRQDERIESNGEKLYPETIEESLKQSFHFEKVIVTHIKQDNNKPIIIAFCHPLPDNKEELVLNQKIGSLFFPSYFFPMPNHLPDQKMLLSDLKKIAANFIFQDI